MGYLREMFKDVTTFVRQNGVIGSIRKAHEDGFLWALLDGNLFHTKVRKVGARLVGEDAFGNKYFEKIQGIQYGRQRWVEYKDPYNYNASTVPPEWHGWLHYISDFTPKDLEPLRPSYLKEHKPNLTGLGDSKIYHAKGHAMSPAQRDWKKVEPWAGMPGSTP